VLLEFSEDIHTWISTSSDSDNVESNFEKHSLFARLLRLFQLEELLSKLSSSYTAQDQRRSSGAFDLGLNPVAHQLARYWSRVQDY